MNSTAWIGAISLLIVFTNLVGIALYRIGHLAARVEELEKWRINIRTDLHEISDKLENMALSIHGLITLIEERTEKRKFPRTSVTET